MFRPFLAKIEHTLNNDSYLTISRDTRRARVDVLLSQCAGRQVGHRAKFLYRASVGCAVGASIDTIKDDGGPAPPSCSALSQMRHSSRNFF